MPDFCEIAFENFTYAVTGRAETLALAERKIHECQVHGDGSACEDIKSLTKQLAQNHEYIGNLIKDMQLCMRRLPVPVGQVRRR